ncbi:hypothetical protein JNUCC32_12540 [Paenibacillus sp. JNUCC32]|uniref:hypothetical protein n=1 Tax=Paenibacillus sp. JNUCC32 TaxID=2777984 RepID=UPI00178883B2|nr:hypothetical protein [Paenibacillus sp. JNUCC-32]QOT12793.1 hypothetical protein JNUCC32_12540 [Paenibacillus sp. JNUCC-32]
MDKNAQLRDVKQKVDKAITKIFERDLYLLINDLNERTIAHKYATYLQEQFSEYDVDCEYNKNADEDKKKKMIYIVEKEYWKIKRLKRTFSADIIQNNIEYMALSIFPDIIVHKRGENLRNHLIVEIKKSTNNNLHEKNFDLTKLNCYTDKTRHNRLAYEFGVFIEFETGVQDPAKPKTTWF